MVILRPRYNFSESFDECSNIIDIIGGYGYTIRTLISQLLYRPIYWFNDSAAGDVAGRIY